MSKSDDVETIYRDRIVEMLYDIKNAKFLEKIHNYVTVPYNLEKYGNVSGNTICFVDNPKMKC